MVYQATVTREDTKEEKTYVGHTRGQFKTRYNNHTNCFRNAKHKHATALEYVCFLKSNQIFYSDFLNQIRLVFKGIKHTIFNELEYHKKMQ